MRLGDGYNNITDKEANPAVFVPPNQVITEESETKQTPESVIGMPVVVHSYPGKIKVRKVTDISQLREAVKATAGLAGKLGELGLSLDVSAERSQRMDTRHTYYLLEMVNTEKTIQLAAPPELTAKAKRMLGVPDAYQAEHFVEPKEEALQGFYRDFGTHYVDQIAYGRRIFALITFDSSKLTDESAVSASIQGGAHVASAHAATELVMSKQKENAVLNISISTDGYNTTSVQPPTSLEDLQRILKMIADKKTHTKDPAIIGYSFKPYETIFRDAHLCPQRIDFFSAQTMRGNACLDGLYKLRAKVVALYCKRYFHGGDLYGIERSAREDQLKSHPYTVRTQYLFECLKKIIRLVDHWICTVNYSHFESTVFANSEIAKNKLFECFSSIKAELSRYADYRLVAEFPIHFKAGKKQIDFTSILLRMPPEAAFLCMVVLRNQVKHVEQMPALPDFSKLLEEDIPIPTDTANDARQSLYHAQPQGDWAALQVRSGFFSCCSASLVDSHNTTEAVNARAINANQSLGITAQRQKADNAETWTIQLFAKQVNECGQKPSAGEQPRTANA